MWGYDIGRNMDLSLFFPTWQHDICENVTWHAKMSQVRRAWIGLWRQLLPTTSGCIYKMLVAYESDIEGMNSFMSWMLCSSLVFQTLLIAIKTSHSWYEKAYPLLHELVPLSARTKLVSKCNFFQSWSALHETTNLVGIGKRKCHMWMWHSKNTMFWIPLNDDLQMRHY